MSYVALDVSALKDRPIRVAIISASDRVGGAAVAAHRLHRSLGELGAKSQMLVRKRTVQDDPTICRIGWAESKLLSRSRLGVVITQLCYESGPAYRSTGLLPSSVSKLLNRSDFDVVNIHWTGGESYALRDLARITKPLIWTMHDMWPFVGAEHYASDNVQAYWRAGATSRPRDQQSGKWLDRRIMSAKSSLWQKVRFGVCPSNWLANCARASRAVNATPIRVIPNAVDPREFAPMPREIVRRSIGVRPQDRAILFGAVGGLADPRKGGDLLLEALERLQERRSIAANLVALVVGQHAPRDDTRLPIRTIWCGHVDSTRRMNELYNAADVTVVSSRQDNLPQVGTEALASGCPVVGFQTAGVPEVTLPTQDQALADPEDPESLASSIEHTLEQYWNDHALREECAAYAQARWSPTVVGTAYLQLYKEVAALQ